MLSVAIEPAKKSASANQRLSSKFAPFTLQCSIRLVIAYFQFGREACEKVWLEWIVRSSFLLPEKTKVIVAENRELDCGIAKSIQTAGGFRHPTTRNPESPIGDDQ